MLEPHPPRRDPRVLAIVPTARGISYAAVDAWEIRGVGTLPNGNAVALRLAVARLLVQTRPTAIVCAEPSRRGTVLRALLHVVAVIAARSGIPVVRLVGKVLRATLENAPSHDHACAQYPELRTLAAGAAHDALRLALGALTSLDLPSRRHARLASHPTPAVAPRRARLDRSASVPHGPAGRGRR